MNEKVSIICLIYQSPEYADYFYDNIMAYTPEIESGEAEFFFVANDATTEVLELLKKRGYPHYVNNNPHYTNEELFARGFSFPEYMARVVSVPVAGTPLTDGAGFNVSCSCAVALTTFI